MTRRAAQIDQTPEFAAKDRESRHNRRENSTFRKAVFIPARKSRFDSSFLKKCENRGPSPPNVSFHW